MDLVITRYFISSILSSTSCLFSVVEENFIFVLQQRNIEASQFPANVSPNSGRAVTNLHVKNEHFYIRFWLPGASVATLVRNTDNLQQWFLTL